MSILLFPHNQTAYESCLSTMETARRACVIHPTGTGKSFIGFKYCEDHPEQLVLWLSPSEYIFKTQCEGLLATGTQVPGNITFMTYAKLSMLGLAELDALHPDVVILDEMHRAAAPIWEKPVQTLLSKNSVVIGLTATHIRYLDGQKDTTATFDMTVASEMTLGEAVVRGILNPPRYVTPSGIKLGYWIAHLRQDRRSKKNHLTQEQIDRLNLIGMAWDADEERWRIGYEAALNYSRMKGNLDVPFTYETPDGYRLRLWIQLLLRQLYIRKLPLTRYCRSNNCHAFRLPRKGREKRHFNHLINAALQSSVYGHFIAALIKRRQYSKGTLSDEQIYDLERIGMRWDFRFERWQEFYEEAQAYFNANGNLKVPREYKTSAGHKLNPWLCRMKREQDRLSTDQIAALTAIGMNWTGEAARQGAAQ